MKYKLLKEIDTDSGLWQCLGLFPIGTEFETDNDYVNVDNGMKIPCKLLIEQGFIEEVKETPKPRWKVGDYVVKEYSNLTPEYIKIAQVWLWNSKEYLYNWNYEEKLRDPTPEELSLYFR